MIDSVAQEHNEESVDKEEPDFFEEHANTDNINSKIDQTPIIPVKKVCTSNHFIVAGSQVFCTACETKGKKTVDSS